MGHSFFLTLFLAIILGGGQFAYNAVNRTVKDLHLGYGHSCAHLSDGNFYCWGYNELAQLGLGHVKNKYFPTRVPKGSNHIYASTLFASSCMVFENNGVKCWGNNESGQLGLGVSEDMMGSVPDETVELLPYLDLGKNAKVKKVFAGVNHSCALFDNHRIKCWGNNDVGQLGLGDRSDRGKLFTDMGDNLPYVDLGKNAETIDLCLGENHTCTLHKDKSLKCFGNYLAIGSGGRADLGIKSGQMGDSLKPIDLGQGAKVSKLACGATSTCVLLTSGQTKCFGSNDEGALGLGLPENIIKGDDPGEMGDALPLLDLAPNMVATDIQCAPHHCCALFENHAMKCWGSNSSGNLGLGDTRNRGVATNDMGDNLPYVNLGRLMKVKSIHTGGEHNCALLQDESVKCWGNNEFGQLGLGGTSAPIGTLPVHMGDNLRSLRLN